MRAIKHKLHCRDQRLLKKFSAPSSRDGSVVDPVIDSNTGGNLIGSGSEIGVVDKTVEETTSYEATLREELKLHWNDFDESALVVVECDSDTDGNDMKHDLAKWALENNITLNASTKLLKVLREHNIDVPSDARTLYKTPRSGEITILEKSGGTYVYFGVEACLNRHMKLVEPQSLGDCIEIDVNIDGLPIFKSRNISVWPIQVAVVNVESVRNKPVVVGMFCGTHKPTSLDFLHDFVAELKTLMSLGYNGVRFGLRSIICDAPARALVKGTVQFNGRYGCDFCEVRGEFDGRMLFLEKGTLRTNESFRSESNEDHHKRPSPFLDLNIDMIHQFPIDPMHCIDLGVTKRLMLLWKEGLKPRRRFKKSHTQLSIISNFNEDISRYFPSSFQRKPRGLEELKMWKATEFRSFLMYVGPVVLKWVLDKEEYELFLSLSVAVSILYNERLIERHCNYADQLLNFFVSNARSMYGDRFCSYNVHLLLHLAEVTKRVGTLSSCSAYKFESNMCDMKRSVRGTGSPILQLANRMSEKMTTEIDCSKGTFNSGKTLKCGYRNCYALKTNEFATIQELGSGEYVVCEIFEDTKAFFKRPCDSRIVGMCKGYRHKTKMRKLHKSAIVGEAIMFPLGLLEQHSSEVCLIKLNHDNVM